MGRDEVPRRRLLARCRRVLAAASELADAGCPMFRYIGLPPSGAALPRIMARYLQSWVQGRSFTLLLWDTVLRCRQLDV